MAQSSSPEGPLTSGHAVSAEARSAFAHAAGFAVAWFAAVVVVAVGLPACNVRAGLAQTELFEFLRPGLIEDCCACLSQRGTGAADATCTEAVLIDGVATIPAGASYGSGDRAFDLDDDRGEGEIPCLCQGDRDTCVAMLATQGDIIVPGACIDQLDREAPCESACVGVLSFDPIQPP